MLVTVKGARASVFVAHVRTLVASEWLAWSLILMVCLTCNSFLISQIDRQTCQIHEMMEKMDFLIDAVQPLLRRHTSEKVCPWGPYRNAIAIQ